MADFIKMTGLYENKDKNGNLYYRGTAQDGKTYWVTLNRNKKGDKYPDAELAYTEADPNYKKGESAPAAKPYVVQPIAQVVPDTDDDGDVPF